MVSCLSNGEMTVSREKLHSRETRGTLGRFRQSLPGLQHSPRRGPCRSGAPRRGTACSPIRLLRRDDAASGLGGHDGVMSTARPAPPAQSAPTFSPGSDQYVNGLPSGFVFPGTEHLNPAEIFSGPGYTAPRPRTDSGATASLTCGLLGFIPLVGVAGIILGIAALRRLRHSYDSGEGMAWLGLILGTGFTLFWLFIVLVLFVI